MGGLTLLSPLLSEEDPLFVCVCLSSQELFRVPSPGRVLSGRLMTLPDRVICRGRFVGGCERYAEPRSRRRRQWSSIAGTRFSSVGRRKAIKEARSSEIGELCNLAQRERERQNELEVWDC